MRRKVMCKPDKTYHCTVRNLNQTLVSEYDITVSREFTNVLDTNDTKQNDDINISDAEPDNKKDKVPLVIKVLYWFLFFSNVFLIVIVLFLIKTFYCISQENIFPKYILGCCLAILILMLLVLINTVIKLCKEGFSSIIPDLNTSYKSFFFYVIVLAIIFGFLLSIINIVPTLLINIICLLFCVLSIFWIIGNIYKAALSDEPKKYEEKINLVCQFNVSVLTLIGVFMDKIEKFDATGFVILEYACALAIFLFAPFIIPKWIYKLRVRFYKVKTNTE